MDGQVRGWVRLGLVALAVPQLVTGVWAVVGPRHWFDHFPGADPRLVAAVPPFNEHLATDAGAGFLATGVALGVAALWATVPLALLALATYLAFSVPHTVYHAANPAPGLSTGEDVANVVTLAVGIALALVLGWAAWRAREPAGETARAADATR